MLIYTSAIYLPWQLLHAVQPPGSEPDAAQFGGNKYILSVIPESKERGCGRLPGAMKRPGKDDVLYAQYWQMEDIAGLRGAPPISAPDYVPKLGESFASVLNGSLTGDVNVVREKLILKNASRKTAATSDSLDFHAWTFRRPGYCGEYVRRRN